jgi:hypothetical protein
MQCVKNTDKNLELYELLPCLQTLGDVKITKNYIIRYRN